MDQNLTTITCTLKEAEAIGFSILKSVMLQKAKILRISININTSICANLVSLRDLHEGLNNLIQMPSVQQALSREKESIQDLESAIRRNGGEKATRDHINAYVASRKKINKMVNKCIKNLKSLNQSSTPLPAIGTMLKETETLDFSTKRVHSEVEQETAAENLCSLNIHKSRKGMDSITLKQLKSAEMSIQELEEGLEALFRSLVKTRVSLLNVLSH
ncbi:UNVERIFIED_CONTAM: hypothetical protein Scaly_1554900 [Sesamum calycinum]|uniref:Uncharacterized protein n=1 Tax=Sesamum calycinum TaxID=2727403 RepID=A0AAW2P5V3_9LAMI